MDHRTGASRRAVVSGIAGTIGAAALGPIASFAQSSAATGTPPSVITNPPRQWGPHAQPNIYPDPDVIVLDPSFASVRIGIAAIRRVATGFRWAEGPAWSSQGQYFVFSDVQGNAQYRLTWEDQRVTTFRKPSQNSNGNSFDFQGRQLTAEHFFRRVVRWEHDGSMTVIAEQFDGKPLNSPNDVVPHPDGSIWFTDPPYGAQLSEGHPDEPGGPANPQGLLNPRIGAPDAGAIGGKKRELPNAVYRWDPSGRLDQVISEAQLRNPNGLCFSPDYRTLYVCSTGRGPGDAHGGGTRTIWAFDVQDGKATNGRDFLDHTIDGVKCGPDGIRADVFGNLWCSANGPLGYAGVFIYNPQGKMIGRIRLPEVCANVCFGGPKRNMLFMTASQSIYMLLLNTQGAAPG